MLRFWILFSSLATTTAWADGTLWQDQGEVKQSPQVQARSTTFTNALQRYRLFGIDDSLLQGQLVQQASNTAAKANSQTIKLPLPDGSFTEVAISPSEVLAPEIAAKHPDIQTWKAVGTDGKTLSGVIDMTPLGFHAMLDMSNGDTVFIEPRTSSGVRQYASLSKQGNPLAFTQEGSCATHGRIQSFSSSLPYAAARSTAAKAGETLQTYNIAIAATAEYNAYQGGPGNTLSAIITTLNRVNQIYGRDLSIHLRLVSGTNIIYTDPANEPYTSGDPSTLIKENIANLNQVIGINNYDVGHVFDASTSGDSLAILNSACTGNKGGGVTRLSASGDIFDIDYVAHELGHQFGATHTFNSTTGSCSGSNREASTAYEPGSGSTIMAYAGICSGNNLQTHSDAMFHAASIAQITDFTQNGVGASCAKSSPINNSNPVVNAGADYTIPAATPFTLAGSATDADSNILTYSWEQLDTGTASNVDVDTGDNALIRAELPTTSPERTIPTIGDLTSGTHTRGETLPGTTRTLNFRLTVRDGDTANGRGTGSDDMRVNVQSTGKAFAVTYPTTKFFAPGTPQTILWEVAGTDQSPISCSAVDIALSTDKGNTFSNLASKLPNIGTATVTLPTTLGSENYLRVKCSNNIFFALSATTPSIATIGTKQSVSVSSVSSSGGGGSMPVEALLSGAAYLLLRKRKGNQS